jgi:hypothetical protein
MKHNEAVALAQWYDKYDAILRDIAAWDARPWPDVNEIQGAFFITGRDPDDSGTWARVIMTKDQANKLLMAEKVRIEGYIKKLGGELE